MTILIVVLIAFYAPVGGGGVIRKAISSIGPGDEVSVSADRQLLVNLLGNRAGEDSVFGSRRMGVGTTEGATEAPLPVVDWEPAVNSGFSVRVQVIGRASSNPGVIDDVGCFTFFFVGSRSADGVTTIAGEDFDQLEQHTRQPPLELPTPLIGVNPLNQRLSVQVSGLEGFAIYWGSDIEVLQSAKSQT